MDTLYIYFLNTALDAIMQFQPGALPVFNYAPQVDLAGHCN